MADLLDVEPIPEGDGESFISVLTDGENCGRPHLVVSQCAHVCQRSVRFEKYLYIRTYHDGYHLFPTEMLFDIEEDPHELRNLAHNRPDLCDKAARLLLNWEQDTMLSGKSDIDPMWTVIREGGPFNASGQLPNYLKRLEATGRSDGAKLLRERHPEESVQYKYIPKLPSAITRVAGRD
jgi:hypothetical protein